MTQFNNHTVVLAEISHREIYGRINIMHTVKETLYTQKQQFAISRYLLDRGAFHSRCDMSKGNESDIEDIVFEILAKTGTIIVLHSFFQN